MIGWFLCAIGKHKWFTMKALATVRRASAGPRTTDICLRCPARKKADGRVVFA